MLQKIMTYSKVFFSFSLLVSSFSPATCFGGEEMTKNHKKFTITLEQIGRYQTGVFDAGAAEISAYDASSQKLFFIAGKSSLVTSLNLADPTTPTFDGIIDIGSNHDGGAPNSIAISDGVVAVAVQNANKQANGKVVFYQASDNTLLNSVTVGALPDMLTWTPDGKKVLVANEGEPNDDNTIDPEGSVSLINLRHGVKNAEVTNLTFTHFNQETPTDLLKRGIRVFGKDALGNPVSVAQDFEPEYITVAANGKTAWVSLQENNAIARIKIKNGSNAIIDKVFGLGFKNHSLAGNGLDASNKDGGVNIRNWPVMGMYQPDSIASYSVRGKTYIVTANEGDSRDYDGFSEEERVKNMPLDPTTFSETDIASDAKLGRLKVTNTLGDTDGDGDFDKLYTYGARSFSIWKARNMKQVYDSGDDFARITAERYGDNFNNTDSDNDGDSRSDDKGAEPEAITVAKIKKRTFAFIGLERMGGIMVYDVTRPKRPKFVEYSSNRDLSKTPSSTVDAGDLAPEGFLHIKAKDSPNGKPLLVTSNETSGTVTIYEIKIVK